MLNIPQEDLSVASYTGEARIVCSNGHVQNRVAMRLVPLDRRGALYSCRRIFGIAGYSTRKVDGAV